MNMKVPFAATGTWRNDIYNYRYAIALWFLLNLMDYGLTVVGLRLGAHEWLLHSFIVSLPVLVFALYKFTLTTVAIALLASCKWLKFLKWLNWVFILVVGSNIYDLIVRPVY